MFGNYISSGSTEFHPEVLNAAPPHFALPALHWLVVGVAASGVGIIAATCFQLLVAITARIANLPVAALLFGAAPVVVWRVKGAWVTPAISAGGFVAGRLLLCPQQGFLLFPPPPPI